MVMVTVFCGQTLSGVVKCCQGFSCLVRYGQILSGIVMCGQVVVKNSHLQSVVELLNGKFLPQI